LMEKSAQMKAGVMSGRDPNTGQTFDRDDDHDENTGTSLKAITSGIGLWVLATASIALFIGAFLGVSIIPTTGYYAMIAGLVIWALFFISLLYIEYKTVHTIVGGLVQSALSGLRTTTGAISGILSPSKSSQMDKQVKNTVHTIYEEADKIIRKNNLNKKLEEYISSITPEIPSQKEMAKDLEEFIDKLEVQERININDDDVFRIMDLQLSKNPKFTEEDAKGIRDNIKKARESADQESTKSRKLAAIIDSIAPMSDKDAKNYRKRLSEILDNTSKDELNSENFERDIEKLFDDPKAGTDQILARLKYFDKEILKEILSEMPHISEERADKLVEMAYGQIRSMKNKTAEKQQGSYKKAKTIPKKIEARIAAFFDNADDPALNYRALKSDVQRIFEDPAHAPQIIGDRMDEMDRDSVISLIVNNSSLSRNRAEEAADRIMDARQRASETLRKVQTEARRRYQYTRRKSIIAAEHARENTVLASWWLFGSAAVSALASVLGAFMAVVV
ncbi:MAG: hypothetical protein ACLFR0_01565, partial [Alphaproteobacteria bacterium]